MLYRFDYQKYIDRLSNLKSRGNDTTLPAADRLEAWVEWGRAQRTTHDMGQALLAIEQIVREMKQ